MHLEFGDVTHPAQLMSTAISSCRLKANEPKIFFSPFYVYVRLGGVIKQPSGHNWLSRNVEIME